LPAMKPRTIVRNALARVGLEGPTRTALSRLGVLRPTEHGHGLLIDLILDERAAGRLRPGQTLVEVGSTREDLPGQGSTAALADLAARLNLRFVTIDMDPENTSRALATVTARSTEFEAINGRGEDVLADWSSKIEFIYLDAFDIDHGQHSQNRVDRYREHLGVAITEHACETMHHACATALMRLEGPMTIVFDDTWRDDRRPSGWAGKGATAVPYMLANGFELVKRRQHSVGLRRN